MRIMMGSLYFLFVLVCWGSAPEIVPIPEIQNEIDRIAVQLGGGIATQDEGLVALKQMDASYTNKQVLVQQVVLYLRFGARTEERGYGAIGIMAKLKVDPIEKIEAVLPLLDVSDPELQELAVDFLRFSDNTRPPEEGVDFSAYEKILGETSNNFATSLIRYMYDRTPEEAVKSMARVFGSKDDVLEVVTHATGEFTADSLEYFADRPEWWAHLYVVEIMKQQPEFRDTTILEKLKKDDNPLIKNTLEEMTFGNPR